MIVYLLPYKNNPLTHTKSNPADSDSDSDSDSDINNMYIKGNMGEKPKSTKPCTFTPPTEADVIAYFEENGYRRDIAKKAFYHYNIADWKDTEGKKVKSWKQKMHTNWFREENRDLNNKKVEVQSPIDIEKQISDWMNDYTYAHENDYMTFDIPKWRKMYIHWLKYQMITNSHMPESFKKKKIEELKAETNGK